MLTEREAWLRLAADIPKIGRSHQGLCRAILVYYKDLLLITWDTWLAMMKRIESHPKYEWMKYIWPNTKEGDRDRVAWCLEQAAKCVCGCDMKCGIKHDLGGQTCDREKGHEGLCRCKAERMGGGSIMYSEWESKDGKFFRHRGYQSIYPKNAAC